MISDTVCDREELRLYYHFEAREQKRLERALASNRDDLAAFELAQ